VVLFRLQFSATFLRPDPRGRNSVAFILGKLLDEDAEGNFSKIMFTSLHLRRAAYLLAGVFSTCTAAAFSFSNIYQFPEPYPSPSGLTLAPDGAYYGACRSAGAYNHGYIFRLTTNGILTTVVSFSNTNGDSPDGGLTLAGDGALYGTTRYGGTASSGTVYRVTTNGVLTSVISFTGTNGPNYGTIPLGLILAKDGVLIGVTGSGTVFQLTTGGTFTSLATLDTSIVGYFLNGRLAEGPDGAFYGTTAGGGTGNHGTIYRVTRGGTSSVILSFNGTNGSSPRAGLIFGTDGNMYGTTYSGGLFSGNGTIFCCSTNGFITNLYSAHVDTGGDGPLAGVVQDVDGTLYGAMAGSWPYPSSGTLFRISTNGGYAPLVTFWGTNGASPLHDLIIGHDGALYGTTDGGGQALGGTIYRLSQAGELTTLAAFHPAGGASPQTSLVEGTNRLLYGTTLYGGTNGVGTVFAITTNGALTLSISCSAAVGASPSSPLIPGPDGNLFGLTSQGGAYGYGTVYRLDPRTAAIEALASFNLSSGDHPQGSFCFGDDGALYGVTDGGDFFYGKLFRITTNGAVTILATFPGSVGGHTEGGIIRGRDGNFYGAASAGGAYSVGSVFRATTNGSIVLLAALNPSTVGSQPRSALVEGPDGAFYGTTFYSSQSPTGVGGYGAVYRVTTNGTLTQLVNFSSFDPNYPQAPLIVGPDGALYGTTYTGGYANGTVFRLSTTSLSVVVGFYNDGYTPIGGLVLGSDGRMYGTTTEFSGGEGSVFAIDPSSSLQAPVVMGSARVISFSGMPNVPYSLRRATTLSGSWSTIATVRADSDGNGIYTNNSAPPTSAFYRLMSK
jgi:uncharacterized repeat protein (TIGR03803 family)